MPRNSQFWLILALWLLAANERTFGADAFDVDLVDSLTVRSGMISFSVSPELKPEVSQNVGNVSIEAARYHKKIFASYLGYRIAQDSEIGRAIYHSGYLGWRYYYYGLGVPIQALRENSLIAWNVPFKPYVESAISIGKILIQSSGTANIQEIAGEYYGLQFGTGVNTTLTRSLALDLTVIGEYASGYGPVVFQSINSMFLLGLVYLY